MARRSRLPSSRTAALAALLAALAAGCGEPAPPRNAVLILLDTLRADRLSSYGYPTKTSPVLDQLAEDGVLFESVVSNAPWTLPAMAGIFSGEFPNKSVYDGYLRRSLVDRIHDAGLRTTAFVEGGFMAERFGFALGFDEYYDGSIGIFLDGRKDRGDGIEDTFAAADEWLRENDDAPFFLLVHSYEPHTPYTRQDYSRGLDSGTLGESFEPVDAARIRQGLLEFGDTERRYVRALYDGGVTTSDRYVGRLLATLEELGIRDETVIVVTSDHGEDIGGRQPETPGMHGHSLYDELLLVPLIIHDPTRRFPVTRVTTQVRTIDIMHTILDLLGFAPAESPHGRSLIPLMAGEETENRFAWSTVAESPYFDFVTRYSLRTGTHKVILTPRKGGGYDTELFDLESDPGERANQIETDASRTARLRKTLLKLRAGLEGRGPARYRVQVKTGMEDIEARLRELGYIE